MANYTNYTNYRYSRNDRLVEKNRAYAEKVRAYYKKELSKKIDADMLKYMDTEDIEAFKKCIELLDEGLDLMCENSSALGRLANVERKVDLILDTLQRQERRRSDF